MMRSILLGAILLSVCSGANAQVSYGLKGGLNLSDIVVNNVINPDAESDYKLKAGVHLGGFVTFALENRFGLTTEILYSVKGVKAVSDNINLHYLTIPILVRYEFADHFFGEAGPEIGYLISATTTYGNANSVWDNKIDIGLDVGVMYQMNKLLLGLRFNAGMSSVIRNTNNSNGENVRFQNRVVQLSIGYVLGDRKL